MEGLKLLVFVFCLLGFLLMFYHFGKLRVLQKLYQKTRAGMAQAERKRLLTSRAKLMRLEEEEGIWFFLERQLWYSGLKRRFPFLGAESFVLFVLLGSSAVFLVTVVFWGIWIGLLAILIFLAMVLAVFMIGKTMEMRAVNGNLMKFLDFLGNYSTTAGDVISNFSQIGKYMEEPLKSTLEQCCMEAQTTGDVGLALLSMADKIEHPQFRELIRNIEVSSRYSADFSVLVTFSRRSMREYLRSGSERKSLLREAGINLVLLLGMSLFALVTVNGLLEVSIWTILFQTVPGKIVLGILGAILALFGRQIYKLEG